MTSPPPLLYDTYYHIYNRGTNSENIFIEERNYQYFLDLHFKYIELVAETFAYYLLRNHFHMLVRVRPEDEIVQSLKTSDTYKGSDKNVPLPPGFASKRFSDFFNAYAKGINKAYGRTGSLFQHPFGRTPVTSSRQFWNVVAYIHQNPQKHTFVDDFRDWRWSSYGILLADTPTRLQRAAVMEWFGGKAGYLELHAQWVVDQNLNPKVLKTFRVCN
jgi:putative transposase